MFSSTSTQRRENVTEDPEVIRTRIQNWVNKYSISSSEDRFKLLDRLITEGVLERVVNCRATLNSHCSLVVTDVARLVLALDEESLNNDKLIGWKDREGYNLLHLLSSYCKYLDKELIETNEQAIERLINCSNWHINIANTNKSGYTPLLIAAKLQNDLLIEQLLTKYHSPSELEQACNLVYSRCSTKILLENAFISARTKEVVLSIYHIDCHYRENKADIVMSAITDNTPDIDTDIFVDVTGCILS